MNCKCTCGIQIIYIKLVYTQAEKHLHIRRDAESRYMAMLEKACKMLADQILGADTESCLTSHESPVGLPREGSSPGGKRAMLNVDPTNASVLWDESNAYAPDLHLVHVGSNGISGCGV